MSSRWDEAVSANRSIVDEFHNDPEAHNRLGKAFAELGRYRDAKQSFRRALELSPHNSIARKNLDRLMQLGDEAPSAMGRGGGAPKRFIEESGKTCLTSLMNPAPAKVLLKLAPGHPVQLDPNGGLAVTDPNGDYVGKVEPRLASRLMRLIRGGNQYEATVTSVDDKGLTIIIREVYKDGSQAGVVSFPTQVGGDGRPQRPSPFVAGELGDEEAEPLDPVAVKDWSNDDTEPGDDEAFTPVLHRIINPADPNGAEDEEF